MKRLHGEYVQHNQILLRQRGFKYKPGANIFIGKDFTFHAGATGYVHHEKNEKGKTVVSIVPAYREPRKKLPFSFQYHPELFPELAA